MHYPHIIDPLGIISPATATHQADEKPANKILIARSLDRMQSQACYQCPMFGIVVNLPVAGVDEI